MIQISLFVILTLLSLVALGKIIFIAVYYIIAHSKKKAITKQLISMKKTAVFLIITIILNEGVNIPKIKVAFILASTTNPKEYIQRT
jgi:superfamily II DNA or RNA helicase